MGVYEKSAAQYFERCELQFPGCLWRRVKFVKCAARTSIPYIHSHASCPDPRLGARLSHTRLLDQLRPEDKFFSGVLGVGCGEPMLQTCISFSWFSPFRPTLHLLSPLPISFIRHLPGSGQSVVSEMGHPHALLDRLDGWPALSVSHQTSEKFYHRISLSQARIYNSFRILTTPS